MQLREKQCNESPLHLETKTRYIDLLSDRLHQGHQLNWKQRDSSTADYSMSGDFLSGVDKVQPEYVIPTPLGDFKCDIALLSYVEGIKKAPLVQAAIEIEMMHRVSPWKAAVYKALGIPFIAVNLHGTNPATITPEWLLRALRGNSKNSHIFIPRGLCPTYLDIPARIRRNERQHTFVVFGSLENLKKLQRDLLFCQKKTKLENVSLTLTVIQGENIQGEFENIPDGVLSENCACLRISLDTPEKRGPSHLFHRLLARAVASPIGRYYVVYKPTTESWNLDPTNPFWHHRVLGQDVAYKIAPKLLTPLAARMKAIETEKHH